jgi:hypothetical protein
LNQLGHACGWLFREAQRPGQMIVMTATEVLKEAFHAGKRHKARLTVGTVT